LPTREHKGMYFAPFLMRLIQKAD